MENTAKNNAALADETVLENQLCFPLYACAKELVRRYAKPLGTIGLTYTQYLVMMVLWENGSLSESEIGEKLHLNSGTLTPLLKRLEKQGLLVRRREPGNERRLILSLTRQGEQLKIQAQAVPQAMRGCLGLPDSQLQQLKNLLNQALWNMEETV